jgi:hypothetical protein
MTETMEYLSGALRKMGTLNLLAIGIVIIVVWLLISGFRKGLRRGGRNKGSEGNDHGE